tara:strand:+ start:31 stop:930 length:900 start_codon:yes stop_codon:yes gene_type:complete
MKIEKNIKLAPFTYFKIGGKAKFFCEPKIEKDFENAFKFARDENLPTFAMGQGANILVSDKGFQGLVIKPKNNQITTKGNIVSAQAGATIEDVIKKSLKSNLIGLEDFSGIPSSVGGALYINLHYFDALIENFVDSALVFNKKTLKTRLVKKSWFKFSYDDSRLKTDKDFILLEANLKLKKVRDNKKYEAIGKSKEITRTRERRYPSEPSVGSIFQNLSDQDQKKHKLPTKSVAFLIDSCGLKGTKVGDAQISPKHANVIVNNRKAKADDVLKLANLIKKKVKRKFGVNLQFEAELVGF